MNVLRRALFAACLLLPGLALAQNAPPTRIRGAIAGLDGDVLNIALREGGFAAVHLPPNLQPTSLAHREFGDIGPNSYIATVASPDASGTLQAVYVLIFSETQRGVGEGHYDWDLAPGTSMTNATVTSPVTSAAGRKLALVYKGTPIEIAVPEKALIVAPAAASRADLRPGAKVFITAVKGADGAFTANRVTVSKDGIDPPQ
jgi:hypothetical protein